MSESVNPDPGGGGGGTSGPAGGSRSGSAPGARSACEIGPAGAVESKKPSGFGTVATRSRFHVATCASRKSGFRFARGSVVEGLGSLPAGCTPHDAESASWGPRCCAWPAPIAAMAIAVAVRNRRIVLPQGRGTAFQRVCKCSEPHCVAARFRFRVTFHLGGHGIQRVEPFRGVTLLAGAQLVDFRQRVAHRFGALGADRTVPAELIQIRPGHYGGRRPLDALLVLRVEF